jgi:hypothetical protein
MKIRIENTIIYVQNRATEKTTQLILSLPVAKAPAISAGIWILNRTLASGDGNGYYMLFTHDTITKIPASPITSHNNRFSTKNFMAWVAPPLELVLLI